MVRTKFETSDGQTALGLLSSTSFGLVFTIFGKFLLCIIIIKQLSRVNTRRREKLQKNSIEKQM